MRNLLSYVKRSLGSIAICSLLASPLPASENVNATEQEQANEVATDAQTRVQLEFQVQEALKTIVKNTAYQADPSAALPMLERVGRVIRSWINWALGKAENPIVMLEQAIRDMQIQQENLRYAVVRAITAQKKVERNYKANLEKVNTWQERAKKALELGDEDLAKAALVRKRAYQNITKVLDKSLTSQREQVDVLKSQLLDFEQRVMEAEAKKEILIARAEAAATREEIREIMDELDVDGANWAIDRAEERVIEMEDEVDSWEELDSETIEERFEEIENGESIEDELERLREENNGL